MYRTAAALLSAGLILAGCGSADSTSAPPANGAHAATTSEPVPVVPVVAEPTVSPLDPASVTGLDPSDAQSAYEFTIEFARDWSYREDLMRTDHSRTAAAYAPATESMSATMAEHWTQLVDGAFAGTEDNPINLFTVAYYNVAEWIDSEPEGEGWTLATTGPIVVNRAITNPVVGVAIDGRPEVTFTETGEIVGEQDGAPIRIGMNKTTTYYLVKAASGSWHLDAFRHSWEGIEYLEGAAAVG